jgi:hypothetical protein
LRHNCAADEHRDRGACGDRHQPPPQWAPCRARSLGGRRRARRNRFGQEKTSDADLGYSLRAILFEALAQHEARLFGQIGRQPRPVRFRTQDGGKRIGDIFAFERTGAGQHLVQHTSERPDVASLVGRLALCLLGAHVRGGAENDAGHARH